jgi:hypothetical protein
MTHTAGGDDAFVATLLAIVTNPVPTGIAADDGTAAPTTAAICGTGSALGVDEFWASYGRSDLPPSSGRFSQLLPHVGGSL